MVVKVFQNNESERCFQDDRGKSTYRYDIHPSGALRIIKTPEYSKGLDYSFVVVTYGPTAWNAVSGTGWGGTDDDLTGPHHNDDPPSDEGFIF